MALRLAQRQSPVMAQSGEIWPRGLWVAIDTAKRGGLQLSKLFDDMPFDEQGARRLRRVSWDDYVEFVDRMQVMAGGPDAMALLAETNLAAAIPELKLLARTLISPKMLLRLHYEVMGPLIFPTMSWLCRDDGADRVHLETTIRPGFRHSLSVHYGLLGAVRGYPRFLGLPPARVTGVTSAAYTEWDVELPESRTFASKPKRMYERAMPRVRSILGYDSQGAAVHATWGAETGEEQRFGTAVRNWTLTTRQLDVLKLVVRGKANKEIARELGTAENTIELHITNLLRRSGTTSRSELIARFWSDP